MTYEELADQQKNKAGIMLKMAQGVLADPSKQKSSPFNVMLRAEMMTEAYLETLESWIEGDDDD